MKKKFVGSRMKEKRKELELTQKEVAERADISFQYYGQIERGKNSPSLETTSNIAKALETSFNWLVNDRAEIMEHRVNEEVARLKEILKDVPKEEKEIVDGLITQAARLRVLLDDNWKDIAENGEYELFSQSKNIKPYERKRPIVETYDNRDRTYKEIMNQLVEMIPAEENKTNKKSKARSMLLGK